MTLTNILVSMLVGGLAGTILTLITNLIIEKHARKVNYLNDQLNKFYAPIQYLILSIEKLLEINRKIMSAYNKEYIEKEWSKKKSTQENLDKETMNTIEIANKYIDQVKVNNEQIIKILNENYSYCDIEDKDMILLFYEHYIRMTKEIDDNDKLMLPVHRPNIIPKYSKLD